MRKRGRSDRLVGAGLPAFSMRAVLDRIWLGEDGKCTHQSTYKSGSLQRVIGEMFPLLERRHSSLCYVIMQAKSAVNATSLSCFPPNLSLSYVHLLGVRNQTPAFEFPWLDLRTAPSKKVLKHYFIAPLFRGLKARGCLPLTHQ